MTLNDAIRAMGTGSLESKLLKLYPYMFCKKFGVFPLADPCGVDIQVEGKFVTLQFIKVCGNKGKSFVHLASDIENFRDIAYGYLITSFPDEPDNCKEKTE